MIPEEKSTAVANALRVAFDVDKCEDVRIMTRGHTSAVVLRIVVRGTPYLLRIIMRPNTIIGPERQFTCMRTAAKAGLAPHVRYTSVENEITITDFVEEVPFPRADALVRMPAVLRSLHALPPFPAGVDAVNTTCTFLLNKGPALEGFLARFQSLDILTSEECADVLGWHAQAAAAYSRNDSDMVSSHNDLFKPDNILFDGQHVWLVDWEAAFRNDRYADLAVVANLVVAGEAEEDAYLAAYLGQAPSEYQRARFYLMRQISHMFYAMGFLFLGSAGSAVNWNESVPGFEEFQRKFWAGEINVAEQDMKIVYGRVHLDRLRQNVRQARWIEALRIVSERRE